MLERDHQLLRLAADLAILTVRDSRLQALVITRRNPPYAGQSALPGGFLRAGEDVRQAAVRELREETGLDGEAEALHLEQLSVYSDPDRDPRGRVVSVTFLALSPDLPVPQAGSDAQHAFWAPVDEIRGTLAFDHDQILNDAVERARSRLEYTTLATAFCEPKFTIGDLRRVYEVVWGAVLDPRNFSRKVMRTNGFVRPTGRKRAPETGRPATLYERGPAQLLTPPLMRGAWRMKSLASSA
ncbi:MAG: NUDIX hydrolase [Pseudonocardia sp.]